MAKILRKFQKLFSSTAPSTQIGVFGSYAAGVPDTDTDPDEIQSLSNFLDGWFAAIVGGNSPALEDWNGLCYLYAYQLCYLFQAGVAEWNASTTYYIGSMVNSAGVIYISLTDTNLNNAVTDTTKWKRLIYIQGTFAAGAACGGSTAVPASATPNEDIYVVGNAAWTARTSAAVSTWQGVAYAPSIPIFVAVAGTGSNLVMSSPDGITWTARTAAAANNWTSVAWSPSLALFAAVSTTGASRVMTSPDGINWTSRSASEANSWQKVIWSVELALFVAVATSGTHRVMTSPDGTTWTNQTAAEANSWYGLCWSPALTLLVATSLDGTHRVMTSPDGTTWTARTSSSQTEWLAVDWSPDLALFAAVAESGTNRVMTSPDGITWTDRNAAAANMWRDIVWSADFGHFVSISLDGTNRVMRSADGITWATMTTPASAWTSLVYASSLKRFVAVASGAVMSFDDNAITANPRIAAGTFEGQRETLLGTDDMLPVVIANGNGIISTSTLRLKKNVAAQFRWDSGQSKWLRII